MDRRRLLTTGAAMGAAMGAAALTGCVPRPTPAYPPQSGEPFEGEGTFPSGVGSADPTPAAVLVWTRVHPDLDRGDGVPVQVEVATTPGFGASTVWSRAAVATGATDHCVTLDVTGLSPGTTYWYRFAAAGATSTVGRTRTAPVGGLERLRVAAFSCQRYTHGHFTAHADLAGLAGWAETDVDLVLCLGDYVYDTGYADRVYVPGRDDPIQDARTLADFRSKYRLYRADPNLQAMHAAYPVVHVFDNHDGMDGPGDPQAPAALQAFFEHLPVRQARPGRIDRSLRWGDLAEVFMCDQRSFRDPTLPEDGPLGTSTASEPRILDPNRTMLGAAQRDWLIGGLVGSDATWKVIGSQLMFWPWRTVPKLLGQPRGSGTYLNLTQWDGYVAERHRILDALEAGDVRNTLLLSGDSHVFSAAQVSTDVDDPRATPRVVELGTGSITSNNADENAYPTDDVTGPFLRSVNPHLRWFESERHGYVVVDLTRAAAVAEFRSPRTIRQPASPVDVLRRLRVRSGTQRLEPA
jgi:alkaline phosphatase D